MALLDSLLTAIVRANGDALVMHVGERPYVVAPSGPVELSSRPLTLEAVSGMLGQLLPHDSRQALDVLGAVEHELPTSSADGGQRFTVVAARGGDDIWIEVRRHRQAGAPESMAAPEPIEMPVAQPPVTEEPPAPQEPAIGELPLVSITAEAPPAIEEAPVARAIQAAVTTPVAAEESPAVTAPDTAPVLELPEFVAMALTAPLARELPVPEPVEARPVDAPGTPATSPVTPEALLETPVPVVRPIIQPPPTPDTTPVPEVAVPPRRPAAGRPFPEPSRPALARPMAPVTAEPPVAAALPSPRLAVRVESTRPMASRSPLADRLLHVAAGRGAQALLLTSQARPAIRVDGGIAFLEEEAPLGPAEIETLLGELVPDRHRDAVRAGAAADWYAELDDIGRVRVVTFRDHRGLGCVLSFAISQTPTVEQLGLAREVQALVSEGDGLVLVAGPRASGKSTLLAALVDLVNRGRGGYVVALERQVRFMHESRAALISQREVTHAGHQGVAAWSALREDPDVLVVDDLRAAAGVEAAIEAASAGRLVVAAVTAHGAADGLDRLLSLVTPESRSDVRLALSGVLRAVVSQVLLRKSGGGRVAARELLLKTEEVGDIVAAGRLEQLPAAQEAGRGAGMIPLADALVAFVQSGVVDAREAYKQASDRPGLLAALRREGLDTSFVERLA